MLNFDDERFLASQRGALAHGPSLHEVVASHAAAGGDSLFFLGAGGAGLLMSPAADLLTRRSSLATYCLTPAELMALGSVHLSSRSLVVIPSRSGDTKEALDVLAYCHAAGARVVALTGTAGSPLALQADVNLTNLVADDNSSESFYLQSLLVAAPVECLLTTQGPAIADLFCTWPALSRLDGVTVRFVAASMQDAIRTLNSLAAMSFVLR